MLTLSGGARWHDAGMRGTRPSARGRRRLIGLGGFALTAVIAVFHGGLLWQRLSDGSLFEPVIVARWAVSAVLCFALLKLWNQGLPVLRGRRAGVLWLIVALLHVFTPGTPLPAVEQVADATLPAGLVLLAFLALWLLDATGGESTSARRPVHPRRHKPPRTSAGWYRVLFSRPPPAPLHP